MGAKLEEMADVVGPAFGRIASIAVTSTAGNTDISADAYVGADLIAGRQLRLRAVGADIYYAWSNTTSTVDDTARGATAGKCVCLPAGQYTDERPPIVGGVLYKYLCYKTATGTSGVLTVRAVTNDPNRYQ
jgi:hypothetical protein